MFRVVTEVQTIQDIGEVARPAGLPWPLRLRRRLHALARDAGTRRPRRVALLLIGAWVINAFDLAFTLLATQHHHFEESNPIAAPLVGNTPALVAYKVLIVAFGSAILLKYRRRVLTEIGCWGVCAVYAMLAGIWWKYYFLSF